MAKGVDIRECRENAYAQRFGTHLPLLAATIAKARPGAVLEIGTGHSSAPLIAEMCKATNRRWYVYDTDEFWLDAVADLQPQIIRDAVFTESVIAAVAFVDCTGHDRLKWIRRFRHLAEFIVVHDTDNPAGDLKYMNDYLDTFTHRYDYKVMTPWTSVVSMTRSYP